MQERAVRSREKILELGLAMMSQVGLSGVTLGRLAEEVGMSKSGLFAHFRSKDEVQMALLEQLRAHAAAHILAPARREPEGLPRLVALVRHWFGWTGRAGLPGGCPLTAGLFELDDVECPVRRKLQQLETRWRGILLTHAREAVRCGHLRADLDVDQFVWELFGIYLAHHTSLRFRRDARADTRATRAFQALLDRSAPSASPAPAAGPATKRRPSRARRA